MAEGGGELTVREAGRLGGRKVAEKYGREFYGEIGKKGGETVKARYGPDYYARIGKIGGSRRGKAKAEGPAEAE